MKEIKYRECSIGKNIFTIKLIYKPSGGLSYNPVVKVYVMKQHAKPATFLEKLLEIPKFFIDSGEWDPLLLNSSLEEYCVYKCRSHVNREDRINRAKIEWGRI